MFRRLENRIVLLSRSLDASKKARVAPMGAPRRAQPCEHGGGNRRQDPRE
jgi:hypothetical protein